jgi:hypothetical protein
MIITSVLYKAEDHLVNMRILHNKRKQLDTHFTFTYTLFRFKVSTFLGPYLSILRRHYTNAGLVIIVCCCRCGLASNVRNMSRLWTWINCKWKWWVHQVGCVYYVHHYVTMMHGPQIIKFMRIFRNKMRNVILPPLCTWDLLSSGLLRGLGWQLVTDVSGKPFVPIVKGQAVQVL